MHAFQQPTWECFASSCPLSKWQQSFEQKKSCSLLLFTILLLLLLLCHFVVLAAIVRYCTNNNNHLRCMASGFVLAYYQTIF